MIIKRRKEIAKNDPTENEAVQFPLAIKKVQKDKRNFT